MRTIDLAFGEGILPLALDDARFAARVLLPHDPPALADPAAAFAQAVERPIAAPALAELARTKRPKSVAIAIADHTRPVPDRLLVPWLVERLGVPDAAVTVLIGTGTHRGSTAAELERMLGPAAKRFRIVNHDCHDDAELVHVGTSSCGGPCWLNRAWVEADLRLATGFIEPHFFAGFSGGTKAIVPGIAGMETVRHFHRARLIAHPATTWGDQRRNPLQALTREMTGFCPADFIVNVTLDGAKRITAVFAGAAVPAHDCRLRSGAGRGVRAGRARVPGGGHHQQRLPARPELLPDGEGHLGGGAHRRARRHDHRRERMPRRPAGRGRVRAPARRSARQRRAARRHPRHRAHPGSTSGRCRPCCSARAGARILLHSRLSPADRAIARVEAIDDVAATLDRMQREHGGRLPVALLPRGPLTIPTLAAAAGAG